MRGPNYRLPKQEIGTRSHSVVEITPYGSVDNEHLSTMFYQICIELPAPTTQLTAILQSFFPVFIEKMHSKVTVSEMVLKNIETWSGILTANMTCGLGMPPLPIRVYQFVPKGPVLQRQFQYLSSGFSEKKNVPIGMKRIDERMLHVCNEYIEQIASHHLDSFAKLCWKEEENKFQEEIFKLIMNCVENEVIRLVRRLVVATFTMSHTLTINKISGLSTEVSDIVSHEIFASSRLLNRQLKYAFHHIQRNLMKTTLSNLKNTLLHPDSYDNWLVAFIAVIGLCMASEDQQKTIHLVMETNINTEKLSRHGSDITADPKEGDETLRQKYEAEGNRACKAIDSVTMFLIHAFCQWSHRSLQNVAHKEGSRNTISEIIQLVKANLGFLTRRKDITIAQSNWRDYTSGLVARLVFMVWDNKKDGENGQGKEGEDREGMKKEEAGREEGEGSDNFADDTAELTMASTKSLRKKAWC